MKKEVKNEKNSKKEVNVKPNNKKIIFEIILIPLCFLYIYYTILWKSPRASALIGEIVIIITCIEFAIKYFKEVYIYEHKFNLLKVLFGIFNVILIIISGLNIIYNIQIINILYLIFAIILLGYLLIFAVNNLICIIKEKGTLYKKAFGAFLSLIAFVIILMSLIISLK